MGHQAKVLGTLFDETLSEHTFAVAHRFPPASIGCDFTGVYELILEVLADLNPFIIKVLPQPRRSLQISSECADARDPS